MKSLFFASAILVAGIALQNNAALAASSERSVAAPKAFYEFCNKHPNQCQVSGKVGPAMPMDRGRWKQLRSVNRQVNRSVREVTDKASWGKADVWSIVSPGQSGDCEDFALTKRKQLIAMGWSSSVLLVSVVRTRRGEGHAVLTVRTSDGYLVLDNKTPFIRKARSTGYRFFTMQSPDNPRSWIRVPLKGPALKTVAAKAKMRRQNNRTAMLR
ncbi:transglutaminase-like cysteine peptidase [Hoeflea sp. TYP-13]|uniref:transglutaminase-like cysteine peptidase n=1 Tax=Hoeflea sp. TYP-13 TaxID=3230023 RepID=UPI0034C5E223